ncbi:MULTISPECIES: hypothetical protein [Pseudomonas]|uniref:Uncharacterized protein n=1 Tax=Pseudomonas aegrilactucae TaxID=2854028 RepID=A0A9Q2XJ43_9PSED|nr:MULTISPECIES: hypothetical protein [Pseudomonas]MBC3410165.1 hypothetical protein [Pseudomonas sp. SWRI51]MBV6287114.1 hypothetical protein [Pseudomonas aegrilactucae]MDD2076720.1 hypothetical protein [Pseudomonas putida]HDS1692671.1 hypothetical protein [Pseudomonas putida]
MASDRKKAKRAKRAKLKAKEARGARHVMSDDNSESLDSIAQSMMSMLVKLGEAEETSMVEMLKTLIIETGRGEIPYLDDEIDSQIIILKVYGRSTEGRTEDWMEQPIFLAAYAEAARWVGRPELIEAWQDAFVLED